MVTRKQSVARIIRELVKAHEDYSADYDRIAEFFITGSNLETEKKLFDFCKENFNYIIEPEKNQTLRSPAAIIVLDMVRGVDCKHYASFIGGVLDAINRTGEMFFDWFFRFASYSVTDRIPEHVFVVVKENGSEIWIDPVLDRFNGRMPFPIYIRDIKSRQAASRISGIGSLSRVAGIGALSRISGPAGYHSTNFGLSSDSSCSSGCSHSIGRIRKRSNQLSGTIFDAAADFVKQVSAGTTAISSSTLFNILPPPAGSMPVATIDGWPPGLPNWVVTPDNRLVLSTIPLNRTPTNQDLAYLLTSLQAIYNVSLITPIDVFRYVSPTGATFAGLLDSNLKKNYGPAIVGAWVYNNWLAVPDLMRNSSPDWVAAIGSTLISIVGLVPVIGNISNLVVSIDQKNKSVATVASAIQQQQVTQTAAALQQLQAPAGSSPLLTWLKSNPGLTVLFAVGGAYGLSKILD